MNTADRLLKKWPRYLLHKVFVHFETIWSLKAEEASKIRKSLESIEARRTKRTRLEYEHEYFYQFRCVA